MRLAPGLVAAIAAALLGCDGEQDQTWTEPGGYVAQFAARAQPVDAKDGQILYVPVYADILVGEGARPTEMAATLAIRNTDMQHEIFVTSVRYYDTAGQLIETYLEGVYGLGPLASASIFINAAGNHGRLGASFVVEWAAESAVSDPVVETIMVGASGTKGFSFTNPARSIAEVAG
jgi:Protein of unknown function (DUF3124)